MQGIDLTDRAPRPRVPRIASGTDSLAASLLQEVLGAEADPDASARITPAPNGAPRPPDASVPSGAIWPPVEGRAILHEVSQLALVTRVLGNGDWSAGLGTGWRIVSCRDSTFESVDAGRSALIHWARLHAACTSSISPRRCIVLAATGDGHWRLWQIVRAEPSLREVLGGANAEPTLELAVHRLCQVAQVLVDVHERLATAACDLPCNLDSVGQSERGGVYIGLMPLPATAAPTIQRLDISALLAAELGPMLDFELAERRGDLGRALERIPKRYGHSDTIFRTLSTLLA